MATTGALLLLGDRGETVNRKELKRQLVLLLTAFAAFLGLVYLSTLGHPQRSTDGLSPHMLLTFPGNPASQ